MSLCVLTEFFFCRTEAEYYHFNQNNPYDDCQLVDLITTLKICCFIMKRDMLDEGKALKWVVYGHYNYTVEHA